MNLKPIQKTGIDAVNLATTLLQRCRLADPYAGVFEAADIQWSWRKPRTSDSEPQLFWMGDNGPVAALYLTAIDENRYQLDPISIPGLDPQILWDPLIQIVRDRQDVEFEIPVRESDADLRLLADSAGFSNDFVDSTGWMDAGECPSARKLPAEYTLIDRTTHVHLPNPLQERNGKSIDERLAQCSLYNPANNLAVLHDSGEVAGYSLYWFDPVTKVGLVEPVRVHDAYQRQGLAKTTLSHGLNRLKELGAERFKVSWETETAGALYTTFGFQFESHTIWFASGSD